MSTRGRTVHLRRISAARTRTTLDGQRGSWALLGSNRAWTSVIPLGEGLLDLQETALELAGPLLDLWFDEDSAVDLRFAAPGGWHAEMTVPLGGDTAALSPEDERLFEELQRRQIVPATTVRSLLQGLRRPPGSRDEWLLAHGIEESLRLPFFRPLPTPCSEALLRHLAPEAVVVNGARREDHLAPSLRTPKTTADLVPRRSAMDPTVVDLHLHYLTAIWSLNNWMVYQRYKKHLPATRRYEVDALVNQMMTGATEANLRAALESILSLTWDAEDWDAVIRDPRILENEPLTSGQREEWRRLLDRSGSGEDRRGG